MNKLLFALPFLAMACTAKQNNDAPPHNRFAANNQVTVYTTADSTDLRLTLTDKLKFEDAVQPLEVETSVFVFPNSHHQTFLGIGGAITDASAEVFAKLDEATQRQFIEAYYDVENGIGYSLLRTTIHSCDFASKSYTYVDEGDKELTSFDIAHEKEARLPMIKKAIDATGGNLVTYASPWSPPAFMKDNNNMLRGGKLLPDYYQAWANYYVKYIKAMEAEGIPIWGVTLQNEPMAVQRWESCIFTAEEERDFLKNFLGPTLAAQGLADKKIIVWNAQPRLNGHRANTIFSDPDAAKYAWGLGYHWYETWSGGQEMNNNVAETCKAFPNKPVLFTEGCIERFDIARYHYWPNAERYGRAMITDFNNGTVGWTDWNILLDQHGGPNHVGNFCFAPVHADLATGKLIFTPIYYYIGHFSKFIRPNAKQISTSSSRSNLLATSFVNTDGKIVTVAMNQSNKPIVYNLIVGDKKVTIGILPHAMQTLVY